MIDFNHFFEPVLFLMLGLAIYRSVKLEKALAELRKGQSLLSSSVSDVDQSAQQASTVMSLMNNRSIDVAEQVAARIEVGRKVCDDLAYLTDRAEILADKLERFIRISRSQSA